LGDFYFFYFWFWHNDLGNKKGAWVHLLLKNRET